MPKYTFECKPCNLRFSKNLKIGKYDHHQCPKCRQSAPRVLEGFGFQFARNPQSPPGNSGVSKHDYPTADVAVGHDAEKRWDHYRRRKVVKDQVRAEGGTHKLARTDGQGYTDYQAISAEGAKNRQHIAGKAVEVLQKTKPVVKSDAELRREVSSTQ